MSQNFTHNKNTVSTPWHIADFVTSYFDCANKKVLDPTAGVGSFLQYCKHKYGIEYLPDVFQQLKENYPEGGFVNASVFDTSEWIQAQETDCVLMNPPFNAPKSIFPACYQSIYGSSGTDTTKGLFFVQYVADLYKSGQLAAIVPVGAIQKNQKIKKELLAHHTLDAVIQLNSELFYPGACVGTVLLLFTLGVPHNSKTLMMDGSNDSLTKKRNVGRIDEDNNWANIKSNWLQILREHTHAPQTENNSTPSAYIDIKNDDWMPRSYFEYSTIPTEEDFRRTVSEYLDFAIKRAGGLDNYLDTNPTLFTIEERVQRIDYQIQQLIKKKELLLSKQTNQKGTAP